MNLLAKTPQVVGGSEVGMSVAIGRKEGWPALWIARSWGCFWPMSPFSHRMLSSKSIGWSQGI